MYIYICRGKSGSGTFCLVCFLSTSRFVLCHTAPTAERQPFHGRGSLVERLMAQ